MSNDEKHSWFDDYANKTDVFHTDDFMYGNNDGYTTFDEMVLADIMRGSTEKKIITSDIDDFDDLEEDSEMDEEDYFDRENGEDVDRGDDSDDDDIDFENYGYLDNISGPLSFTITVGDPGEKRIKKGVWKYYDGFDWEFGAALIDHFPELSSDYESGCRDDICDIISETYDIDKSRAIKYLLWVWENFPKELFIKEKDNNPLERNDYKSRGGVVLRLIYDYKNDQELLNLLKTQKFIDATFKEGLIVKHDITLPEEYIGILLCNNCFDYAIKAYNAFLVGQKGRYGEVDLGKLWEGIVSKIYYDSYDEDDILSEETKIELFKKIRPVVEKIGIRGGKIIKTIDDNVSVLLNEINEKTEEESEELDNQYEPIICNIYDYLFGKGWEEESIDDFVKYLKDNDKKYR